jgi:hypothetical protein
MNVAIDDDLGNLAKSLDLRDGRHHGIYLYLARLLPTGKTKNAGCTQCIQREADSELISKENLK